MHVVIATDGKLDVETASTFAASLSGPDGRVTVLTHEVNRGKADARCHWLWQSMVILWDGSVTPCCFKNTKPEVGSVVSDSISQVWNGQVYIKSRELFCGEKVPDEANKECTYCNLFA